MLSKLIIALLLAPVFAFAAPEKVKTSVVRGNVAAEKFLAFVPVGKYSGTFGPKKQECEVEIVKSKNYLEVFVDDLSTAVSFAVNTQLKESKSSVAFVEEEEDGDEANGAYLFTRTARVTRLKGGLLKVSTIREKEYLDKEADNEVEVRTCSIKL